MATTTKTKPERLLFGYKPYPPNATFKEVTAEMEQPLPLASWLEFGKKWKRTIAFKDYHGTGKTSAITEWLDLHRIACVYLNAANLAAGDVIVIAPVRLPGGKIVLRELTLGNLQMDVPFVVYVDDMRQAPQKVQNELLPLVGNGTVGMTRPKNLLFVVMSDNEGAFEGIRTTEDPAMTDRPDTVPLEANDTGWRYALAAKYATVDLKPVFRVWDSLEPELRHILSPRCLDHVIYCTLNGFPPILGLPILGDQRMRLVASKTTTDGKAKAGDDRTVQILEKIAHGLNVPYVESVPDVARKAVKAAFRDRLTILLQGPPGMGKTEMTKQMVKDAGFFPAYFSVAHTDPERLVVPLPDGDKIQAVLAEVLQQENPYAIIWDEYNRPQSDATFSKLMEATQQWSIAGVPLTACRAQIALCNPSEWNGRKMNVRKNNIAQADRFTISIQLTAEDIPSYEWLLTQWPLTVSEDSEKQARAKQIMEAIVDWHKTDIGNEQRDWISARCLERFGELAFDGMPLKNGKPYLGNREFAPVTLVDLEQRLAERPIARLKEIALNVDEWEKKLMAASEISEEGTNDTDQVHQAFTLAEVSQLWESQEAVIRLVRWLPPKLKGTFFLEVTDEEQKFWISTFRTVRERAAKAVA